MSDKEPWTETWALDNEGDARRVSRLGKQTTLVFLRASGGTKATQGLAVQAPRLYRALEALMSLKGLSGYIASTEEWTEAMAALKAARGEE